MKTTALLMLLFIGTAVAIAGDCPVEILQVFRTADGAFQNINVRFKNTAGKDIKGIKLGFVFFNAVDEPFTEAGDFSAWVDSGNWNPDATDQPVRTIAWRLHSEGMVYIDAYPIKVKFWDGNLWTDDGSAQCNQGVPQLRIAKQSGLRAALATLEIRPTEQNTGKSTAKQR